ncbi:AAA family ATPase, partial [Streptomyces sp. NPDC001215]
MGERKPEADAQILRRHFLAIATGTYDSPQWESLPVTNEVQALSDWLCAQELGDRCFTQEHPELAADPDLDQIRRVLENVPWREADAAVVFVTGHGEQADGAHWIVLRQTHPGRWHSSAIRTADLVGWLKDSGIEHLLLIFDLCYAGSITAQTSLFDKDVPRSWLVLPSAARNQQAYPGVFTGAVTAVLADLASPEGERFGIHNRLLRVEDFIQALEDKLGEEQRIIPLQGSQLYGPHPCLPNPHYSPDAHVSVAPSRRDLALLRADIDAHWGPRSRGVTDHGDPGWFFTGRARLMRELITDLHRKPGTVLLTGAAGTGKSAVLGRLVTLADPNFLATYHSRVEQIPYELRPPPGSIDVAVLATGKNASEIAHQISGALGVEAPHAADPWLERWSKAWEEWLDRHATPVTIVIDAVDEAEDPERLLYRLLVELPGGPGAPRLHLLLGVRSPSGPEQSTSSLVARKAEPLADRIARELNARRIKVDEVPWYDEHDLADYATTILTQTAGSPYGDSYATREVGDALARHAQRSYLIIRLAAASLARQHEPVRAQDPHWLSTLHEGVRGVFRADLHNLLRDPDERLHAVQLLRAVAFGRGKGLPWHRIWPAFSNAIAVADVTYGDSDIAEVFASPLAGYLTIDVADDTTVYRIFHDALRSALIDNWRALVAIDSQPRPPAHAVAKEIITTEKQITRALVYLADRFLNAPTSRPLPPYIRRHLAEHAATGGLLNNQTLNIPLLLQLDITRAYPLLLDIPATQLSTAPILQEVPVWSYDRPQDNATTLDLWAAFLDKPLPEPSGSPWHAIWIPSQPQSGRSNVDGITGWVWSATGIGIRDGRSVGLAGGTKGVSLWDLNDEHPAPSHIDGITGLVKSVAGMELCDGSSVGLAGGTDGVWVWDLNDEHPAPSHIDGITGFTKSVAGVELHDGRSVGLA